MPSAILQQLYEAFTAIPFNKMLGLRLDELSINHVTMNFDMKQELIGNFLHGSLHGGVISSVLDMAGGMAAMSAAVHSADKSIDDLMCIVGRTTTIDLHISYLRPGLGKTFIAKAWLTKKGKKISFSHMELSNEEGTLIATGSATYLCA
jgi:uncharacterized protein (TIGR00369 family)